MDIREKLQEINPLNLFDQILYVCGVVLLIYAIMQLVHGLEAKEGESKKRGMLFLLLSLFLILQRYFLQALGII